MLKFEPPEISWVQYFHDQAVDSREYVKAVSDRIPIEVRDALLSIVRWAEETERSCDMWCDINHKQCYEETRLNMFLEEQIKALFATIRATKHADSIRVLREAARDAATAFELGNTKPSRKDCKTRDL